MDNRVNELLERWENEQLAGRDLSAEELCIQCPELVGEVRDGIRRLLWVNSMNERARDNSGEPPTWAKGAYPLPGSRLIEDRPFAWGGSGEVWRAETPGGFRHVLKRVRLGGPLADEEERAMKLLPKLSRHPHLLEVRDVQCLGGELVIAMEEADGSLKDRLKACQDKGLPIKELLRFMQDAAEGLDHLGEQGIQHRDIKPDNLLLVGGRVKVGDFGLAKILERTRGSHSGPKTPAYAAPEWHRGQSARQSDQYCLCVTYFHLRTGRLPVDLPILLTSEAEVLARALSNEPADRWPSCLAFVAALESAVLLPASAPRPEPEEEFPELTLMEELVLLSRDDHTGKRLANDTFPKEFWGGPKRSRPSVWAGYTIECFSYALHGAALAELLLRGHIALRNGAVQVLSSQATGDDVLDRYLHVCLQGRGGMFPLEGDQSGRVHEEDILARLVKRGVLKQGTTTRLWVFTGIIYKPQSGPKLRLVQRLVQAFAASSGAVPRRVRMLLALLHESENWSLVAPYTGGLSSKAELDRLFGTNDEAITLIRKAVNSALERKASEANDHSGEGG